MASSLADETLVHILEQVLEVEDADFASCAEISPFGNRQASSSNLLLVSKRWLRVCTPALYSCIILRSTAQAQSLIRALKKTKFGSYIRQLRLEGWFGAPIPKIFAAAINLEDICFPMMVDTKDNVQSFCSSIGSLSVQRIIMWNRSGWPSKASTAVHTAVSVWLKSIETPVSQCISRGDIRSQFWLIGRGYSFFPCPLRGRVDGYRLWNSRAHRSHPPRRGSLDDTL